LRSRLEEVHGLNASVAHFYVRERLMKAVSARYANQRFSELLAQVESGEEIVITKRGHPVVVLRPYRMPAMTRARRAAIKRAVEVMAKGLPWSRALRTYRRDEMYDR
jgi:prevent-host-death family protein